MKYRIAGSLARPSRTGCEASPTGNGKAGGMA